ncbi:Mitochondrial division protein 1 [Golovinomyces cichoracearum]|uniref:Mitochondrial division protein 1 n=1 Tax=Golovinomyces cichoracearum TaxID=62708 RepID=A0A420HN42_9PEZI|nr:Mitochondrial division protein 1 [Golovinomyces cichoracearum]
MAGPSSHNGTPAEGDTALISTKTIETFGRKFTTTASHLIGDPISSSHYQNAMSDLHKQLLRPNIQRSIFSFAKSSPSDIVRSSLSKSEIRYRALAHLPDELLKNIPENENSFSLFQGFQASLPSSSSKEKRSQRKIPKERQLEGGSSESANQSSIAALENEKSSLCHQMEMMKIRKNMASSEIREIDNKVSNLMSMRKILLERLAWIENEEALLEHEILDVENRFEDAQELIGDAEALALESPSDEKLNSSDSDTTEQAFMSESIYEKLKPSNVASKRTKIHTSTRKKSLPILHEHMKPGSIIREFRAHPDAITTMDFDAPFGTLVTAALDDTVKVWDMNAGRCMGLLEGHTASVRVLQVEDNIVATGSADATIRLWDLQNSSYDTYNNRIHKKVKNNEPSALEKSEDEETEPPIGSMQNCSLFSLEAHMDEVTALHFRGDTLISGSADKTLRQWDLEKGRCVQTLDVMWASAQATSSMGSMQGIWRKTGKAPGSDVDFVGAVQVFDAALACGTADGMVRLWDLRSGQVHRSLVGHTGPVTCLRFDDVHLVTGSLDRSVRIWDLRTGAIYDAYAYDSPVTSMMFDNRRIVTAAGEDVVKVYDKLEGRHWNCGAGVNAETNGNKVAIVERVGIIDGYMTEGRRDGMVGIWTC